jgi:cardiolipin synthase (CMP-forming)
MSRGSLLTLPNILSLVRIPLAAAFLAMQGTPERVAIIGAAGVSDVLDGWIARRRNAVTRWGALLDPVADRFFVFTAICALLFSGTVGTAQYFVFLSRDLATAIGFLVARAIPWLRAVPFQARALGKAVTVLQQLFLLVALLAPGYVNAMLVTIALVSAASIVDYTLMLWRARPR